MQKGKGKGHKLPERFPGGEILCQTQPVKKQWKLGELLGQGGFGLIYSAFDVTDGPSSVSSPYVIKIEPLDNGPLFCEFHFYQRAAKPDMIAQWRQRKKLPYLGVPEFLGSGQHRKGNNQYRFLVLQRLSFDLQKVFVQNGRSFSEKTALSVGLRMLDALEYIHNKGYCHADIKAANILLGFSNGKTDFNQVYLVDYGLVASYLVDGAHKHYREDPKCVHDGTTEYTSRDAHKGACPSRRGDVEILGYCMLEWLSGRLLWDKVLYDKNRVRDLKVQYMKDIPGLLTACFGTKRYPEGVRRYLESVAQLAYDATPDYHQLRQCLRSGLDNEWTLGLTDLASHARGVKRKNDRADLPTPQQRKVRPVTPACSSAPPAKPPVVFQTPARRPRPSGSQPTAVGNHRKALTNPKVPPSPAHAVKTPGSAFSVPNSRNSFPGNQRTVLTNPKTPSSACAAKASGSAFTISKQSRNLGSKTAAKTSADGSGRKRPTTVSASSSGVRPSPAVERTVTRVRVYRQEEPDRRCYYQEPEEVCCEDQDWAPGHEVDGVHYQETDEDYSQEDYDQHSDGVHDWPENDAQDAEDSSCPGEEGSTWGCSIL